MADEDDNYYDGDATYYVLSPSEEWTRGFLIGRFPGVIQPVGKHLTPSRVDEVRPRDNVVILGGWDLGLADRWRHEVEKALHESGARIQNGAGLTYQWPYPHPWDPDGKCCR